MTREEQIKGAERKTYKLGFYNGVKWADANRWVKVEDRLPDTTDLCIVCINEEEFEFDRFTDSAGSPKGVHSCFTNKDVTHWQYVTLPPKAEQ